MRKVFIESKTFKYWTSGIVFAIILILSYQKLSFYVRFDFNFILLLLALPFVVTRKNRIISLRYGLISILFLVLYPILKLSSVYFFAIICFIFFLYESQFGKLNVLPLFLVIIVSPVVIFLSELVGFEIRLLLTKIAANMLNIINENYTAVGNIIVLEDKEFHVDPICMGLKMVILSFFSALVLISFHQKRIKSELKIISVLIIFAITYLLVILSNLFRIILITFLNIAPENLTHELIGIFCFIIYVILPLLLIIKRLPAIKHKEVIKKTSSETTNSKYFIIILVVIGLMLFYNITPLEKNKDSIINIHNINVDIENYDCSKEEHDVIKLTNSDILIYLKPAASFYSAEHSPIICWKGSGYKIEKEQILALKGGNVYFSELRQGKDILYSIWWYDCGTHKTISQFTWRSKSLFKNQDYHLVNLISNDKSIILRESEKMLEKDLFSN